MNDMNVDRPMSHPATETPRPSRRKKAAAPTEADSAAMRKTNGPDVEHMSFEAAVARLESIVSALEGGGESAPLDESLRLYEEGIALVRRCIGELDTAQQRVQILQRTEDGEIAPVDFTSTPDEV